MRLVRFNGSGQLAFGLDPLEQGQTSGHFGPCLACQGGGEGAGGERGIEYFWKGETGRVRARMSGAWLGLWVDENTPLGLMRGLAFVRRHTISQ